MGHNQRDKFWKMLGLEGTSRSSNVIINAYLNFTVTTQEIWGKNAHLDPFLIDFFKSRGLIDIEPIDMRPT